MTQYKHIRCFWAVGFWFVLIILILFLKKRNRYGKFLLSFWNLTLLQQLWLFLDPRGMTYLHKLKLCHTFSFIWKPSIEFFIINDIKNLSGMCFGLSKLLWLNSTKIRDWLDNYWIKVSKRYFHNTWLRL